MKMCLPFKKKKNFSVPFIAFFQALGLLFYCGLVGLLFWRGEKWFGPISYYWGPLFFLVLFIVSALICALIAFGYAFILFWERKQTGVLKARTEFASALNQICAEKGIEPDVALESIKSAVLAAYRKDYGVKEGMDYSVDLDMETGSFKVYEFPEEKEEKKKEVTPPGFGRIASMTAKQVIIQKLREAEKTAILDEYSTRAGTLVSGMIIRFDGPNAIVDIGKAEGVMPPQEQIRAERYSVNQRLTFLIKEIRDTARGREEIAFLA